MITGLEASRAPAAGATSTAVAARIHGGIGTAIISTSRGVMTGHEAEAAGRCGGEVVASVW